MNIISKAIVEYKYSRKFKRTGKISSIKYAIQHMFDKDRDFADLMKAIDKAKDRIKESHGKGTNFCIVTQDFVDDNAQYLKDNNIECLVVPPIKSQQSVIGHYNAEYNEILTDIRKDINTKRSNGLVDY
jgi:hypothetical protein